MMLNVIQLLMSPLIDHYLLIHRLLCSRLSAIIRNRESAHECDEGYYFPLGDWDHDGSSNAVRETRAASSPLDKPFPGPD